VNAMFIFFDKSVYLPRDSLLSLGSNRLRANSNEVIRGAFFRGNRFMKLVASPCTHVLLFPLREKVFPFLSGEGRRQCLV